MTIKTAAPSVPRRRGDANDLDDRLTQLEKLIADQQPAVRQADQHASG
jgi:hypothetical protein